MLHSPALTAVPRQIANLNERITILYCTVPLALSQLLYCIYCTVGYGLVIGVQRNILYCTRLLPSIYSLYIAPFSVVAVQIVQFTILYCTDKNVADLPATSEWCTCQ